jgi:pyruvate kinase
MKPLLHRTKIVATIGPASDSPEMIRKMLWAGMNAARLNFSHGNYADHAERIQWLRAAAEELDLPLMLLQDLQGSKIRVGTLPAEGMMLDTGASLILVPIADYSGQPHTIGIDYPRVAAVAESGIPVLLDDGLLELRVVKVDGNRVQCQVIVGGLLKSYTGVNFPTLNLHMRSMTPWIYSVLSPSRKRVSPLTSPRRNVRKLQSSPTPLIRKCIGVSA